MKQTKSETEKRALANTLYGRSTPVSLPVSNVPSYYDSGNSYYDSGGTSAIPPLTLDDLKGMFEGFVGEAEAYANELKEFAQDDYDFTAKWIESQYKQALGNDDTERANFLKEVANSLESSVGRIQFDYRTGKYRTERDRDRALARLDQDEAVARQDMELENQLAREDQAAGLNARGILSTTRDNAQGLAGQQVGRLEQDIDRRFQALDRAVGRSREDILTSSGDRLEDVTTSARRAGEDATTSRDYGIESAGRERDRRFLDADQQLSGLKKTIDSSVKTLGRYI